MNICRFNPCFNGFMDKCLGSLQVGLLPSAVSTLVLMDSWINAFDTDPSVALRRNSFNPCFNGFMDKCIELEFILDQQGFLFQPLF